mmetsp:Transcript_107318/g.256263  ORF Transcript_107318/g.256263 Transcript_107318/m.256263 type:complete len:1086 (+) Transcript_107318:103-3360(+)
MQIGYVGGAVAGAAAGVQALFDYNQKNFKYDREMRQKTEFKTREWRNAQCDLWRDDIREIIGLTERKMDSYLVVGTLQLGMTVVLFCEGRLEPGTPPWLLHMYMMTIGGSFMYLLMAVWLAMHASIVAQCSEVRLLTQFVRRPVPTWEELQDMRTFAQTYEHLDAGQVMRVPFTGRAKPDSRGEASTNFGAPFGSAKPSPTVGALPSSKAAERAIDPWSKEAHAEDRQGLYELQRIPIERRRHIYLARRAAAQYQAFDAFTRTALSCGTHQMLGAVAYYCIGYCSIQDGAPWPAFCVSAVMVSASVAIATLDFSMTRREQVLARVLLVTGPMLAATMAWACACQLPFANFLVYVAFPLATLSHTCWLLFSLRALDVQKQQNGTYLPMKFRAVLYLDVFGWLKGNKGKSFQSEAESPASKRDYVQLSHDSAQRYNTMRTEFEIVPQAEQSSDSESEDLDLSELQRGIREQISMWYDDKVWPHLDEEERKRVNQFAQRYRSITGEEAQRSLPAGSSRPWLKLSGYADTGTEAPYLFQPDTGEVLHLPQVGGAASSKAQADDESAQSDDFWGEQPSDVRSISMMEQDLEAFMERCREEPGWRPNLRKRREAGTTDGANQVMEFLTGGSDSDKEFCEDPAVVGEIKQRRVGMESYCPLGRRSLHPECSKLHGEPDEDVVMGYGDLKPGVVPWQIFRQATVVLALLWVLASWLPLFLDKGGLLRGVNLLPREMGVGGDLEDEVQNQEIRQKQKEHLAKLDMLPGGELVNAIWPSHSGFEPRALSCDPLGKRIVVADDFGIYAAELRTETVELPGKLRGGASDGRTKTQLTATFFHQPHCKAIEGHGLQDVSVACADQANGESHHCRALVLHEEGRTLSECDLKLQSPLHDAAKDESPAGLPSWDVTTTWLRSDDSEYVDSAAVNSNCLTHQSPHLEVGASAGEFRPQVMDGGCVVAGTSMGRIVKMRTHYFNHSQLVPESAVRNWECPISQGALHVLNTGIVLGLHDGTAVRAFDSESGASMGDWRLPSDAKDLPEDDNQIRWSHLCGGGESIFILGRSTLGARLYRFSMPRSVQAWEAPPEDTLNTLQT